MFGGLGLRVFGFLGGLLSKCCLRGFKAVCSFSDRSRIGYGALCCSARLLLMIILHAVFLNETLCMF